MPFASQMRPNKLPAGDVSEPAFSLDSDRYQIIVKSFRRFDSLLRLIRSIKHFYPTARVLVADDSFETLPESMPEEVREIQHTPGVSWLQFPFDTGLGACRNRMVELSHAKYIVNCDDDFVFTDETRLDKMIDILDRDAQVEICAGLVREQGVAKNWVGEFSRRLTADGRQNVLQVKPLSSPWQRANGAHYRKSDLVLNFLMARREVLLRCPWDDQFKIVGEHLDHFLSAHEKGVHVVYTPESVVDHRRAMPEGYTEFRRRFAYYNRLLADKWKLARLPNHRAIAEPGVPVRENKPESNTVRKPNIIVLGVGHSNTTITTRQLAELGWRLGDADQEYAESVGVRAVNQQPEFDEDAAKIALEKLPHPWVVKDPRFARTLPLWIPTLAPYQPLLAWIQKDLAVVKESYRTRGETDARVEELFANCQQHFDAWPWAKVQIRAEDVAAAVAMFRKRQTDQ